MRMQKYGLWSFLLWNDFRKDRRLAIQFLQCGMMKLKLMMRIIMPVPVGQRYSPIDTKAAKWTEDPKRHTFKEFQPEKSRHPKASMCFKHHLRSANWSRLHIFFSGIFDCPKPPPTPPTQPPLSETLRSASGGGRTRQAFGSGTRIHPSPRGWHLWWSSVTSADIFGGKEI